MYLYCDLSVLYFQGQGVYHTFWTNSTGRFIIHLLWIGCRQIAFEWILYLANISKQGADLYLGDANDPYKIYIII